jgi:hypothetical protein
VLLSLRVGFGQQHERAAHQLRKKMAAEAVGFMSRGANGGRAAELVTRDFLGGCSGADDASRDAARQQHDATVSLLCFVGGLAFRRIGGRFASIDCVACGKSSRSASCE